MNFVLVASVLCAAAFAGAWVLGWSMSRAWRPADAARPAPAPAFAAGILPLACASVAVACFVAPALLLYEPRDTTEIPGILLTTAGALGLLALGRTGVRIARMLAATHRATRAWRRTAEALPGLDELPALAVDAPRALAAVAGFSRPVLYIDRRVLTACSMEELRAIAAHEVAHVRAHDNAKRVLLAATRGARHPLVELWRAAAEQDADRCAASDARRAVALASALIKVARAIPVSPHEHLAISTIHDGAGVEQRVRALLADRAPAPVRRQRSDALLGLAALSLTPLAWWPVHQALEIVLHALP